MPLMNGPPRPSMVKPPCDLERLSARNVGLDLVIAEIGKVHQSRCHGGSGGDCGSFMEH
jgi:hypothetical protein